MADNYGITYKFDDQCCFHVSINMVPIDIKP